MRDDKVDPFTGLSRMRQAGVLDEAYLDADGRFVADAWNGAHGERCDIANPSSMAAIYGATVSYFVRTIRPTLNFMRREGPVWLSCVSSLSAHAELRRAHAKERQRQGGLQTGRKNLIRREASLTAAVLQTEGVPSVWKVSSGQAW